MFHPNSQIFHQCFLSLCLKISNYAFEMCCIFIPFIIHFIFLYSGVVGSGLAVLSKFRILDTFFHKFLHNGYFWDVFHGDWFAGKGLGCAIVEHPLKRIHLFNTHVSLFVSFIFDVNCWYFFKRCLEVLLFEVKFSGLQYSDLKEGVYERKCPCTRNFFGYEMSMYKKFLWLWKEMQLLFNELKKRVTKCRIKQLIRQDISQEN